MIDASPSSALAARERGAARADGCRLTPLLTQANGLYPPTYELFTEIVTNPATIEDNGLLNLRRRIPADGPQHGCEVGCSANMCKGEELEAYLERHGGRSSYDRLIYLGDGSNDFCPVLRLGKNDIALVRKGMGLERRIRDEGGVQCDVRYWKNAWEVSCYEGEEEFSSYHWSDADLGSGRRTFRSSSRWRSLTRAPWSNRYHTAYSQSDRHVSQVSIANVTVTR